MKKSALRALLQPIDQRREHSSLFPYIDLSSVDSGLKQVRDVSWVAPAEAPSRARQIVKANDVLVSTVRPNLNGVASVPQEYDGAIASTGFAVLRPRPEILDSRYLFQWVRTASFIGDMVRKSTGISYPAVSGSIVRDSSVPLPGLAEQRRIATILDQADELRAKRRRTLALLDEALPAAFADLFHGTTNASARLIDVGVIRTGKTPAAGSINKRSLGTPFITPGDLTSGRPATRYVHDLDALSKVAVPAGSLLVCCIGATVGKMALATEVSVYNQQINSVEWGPSVEPAYGLLAVKELKGRIRSAAASTTMPILNKTQFSALTIPVPPLADQHAFGKIFQEHVRSRERAVKHLAYLDELFASLQYRAFTGQL